jgi:hypothetical protein
MNLKMNSLSGIQLAGVFLGQRAFAQSTPPLKAAPVFVSLPKDIRCSIQRMSIRVTGPGKNGEIVYTDSMANGKLRCQHYNEPL